MGIFSKKSKTSTVNEDNRVINDQSGSTFDNSVDSSSSYEDNSYTDTSKHFTDESYTDRSRHYNDESYTDNSIDNSGDNAGNSGSIVITDGGAFDLVESVVSDFTEMGGNAFLMGEFSLETMGKTAELSIEQAVINSGLMRDVANNALTEYTSLSANSIGAIENTAAASMLASGNDVYQMKELAATALQEMSAQSAVAVSSSNTANRDALAASTKLMTTVSASGNDLLIDGVVNIAKYAGVGFASLVVGLVVIKVIGGNK